MAFSHELGQAGHTPEEVHTKADVTFVPGTGITGSHLTMSRQGSRHLRGGVPEDRRGRQDGLPGFRRLASIDITLDATLAS